MDVGRAVGVFGEVSWTEKFSKNKSVLCQALNEKKHSWLSNLLFLTSVILNTEKTLIGFKTIIPW